MPEPVIIIGMHRSGTATLTRLLEHLGVFMGHDQDPNAEARFFLNLNRQMFAWCGARWDYPDGVRKVLSDEALRDRLAQWLDDALSAPASRLYLGRWGWLRYRDPRALSRVWGWKDPRNTFTLPVWLRLFPEAKVVHIHRHGVDVAVSLQARERRLRQETVANFPAGEWCLTSPLCMDMHYGFRLWEQYIEEAAAVRKRVAPQHWLEIGYEAMLERPHAAAAQLAGWLGREVTQAANDWAGRIHGERAFAFRRDAGLQAFARQVADSSCLQRYGYGENRS